MNDPQIGPDGWYDDWPEWAKNPLSEGARDVPWRDINVPNPKKVDDRNRGYVNWMRLTHNGRRSLSNPICSECGAIMTDEEMAELSPAAAPRAHEAAE